MIMVDQQSISMFHRPRYIRTTLWSVLFFSFFPLLATGGAPGPREPRAAAVPPSIRWVAPPGGEDAAVLARWRVSVGPPVVAGGRQGWEGPANELTVVSWNVALGAGDLRRFVSTLPTGRPLLLLLQEVFRGGPEVPAVLPPGAAFARRQGGASAGPRYEEIESVASALGLTLYYAPSMRNGGPAASNEDRGNAILSNLPLADLTAVELPFERQRRVAVAATLAGHTSAGTPWQVRLVNAHFDNTFSPRRLWLAAEYGRTRQARGLLPSLDDRGPLILGGDFNTWSGFSDRAYLTLARAFPGTRVVDRRATFRGLLRLDHMFFRLPSGWAATLRRADDRFGSDHSPLVAIVKF